MKRLLYAPSAPVRRSAVRRRLKEDGAAFGLMAVPLAWWCLFFGYAFVSVVVNSFTQWDLTSHFAIGFDNYIQIFQSGEILQSFINSVWWALLTVLFINFLGLAMALLIQRVKNGILQKIFLALLFWPTLVSVAASAEITRTVLDGSANGLLNKLFLNLGFIRRPIGWLTESRSPINILLMALGAVSEPIGWLDNPSAALLALMSVPVLLGFGTKMIIYYTGLKNVPRAYYEAASLESNSKWRIFWHITFPMLRPVLTVNLVMSVIEGFKVLSPMLLITAGDPDYKTSSLLYLMYQEGFEYSNMGYACAVAIVLFAVIFAVSMLQLKLQGGNDDYE